MGVKNINDALTIASYAGLDLVLINGNSEPNVCKIMDYNKFKYEKAKKQKEALKKQKASNMELKEYRLSPVIDVGDFDTKVRNASKYLEKGHKVKLSIRFKGRQIAHPELAEEIANLTNTINYEIICIIGKRVPRVYFKNGKNVGTLDYIYPSNLKN